MSSQVPTPRPDWPPLAHALPSRATGESRVGLVGPAPQVEELDIRDIPAGGVAYVDELRAGPAGHAPPGLGVPRVATRRFLTLFPG